MKIGWQTSNFILISLTAEKHKRNNSDVLTRPIISMGDQFEASLLLQQNIRDNKRRCPCCSVYYSDWSQKEIFLPRSQNRNDSEDGSSKDLSMLNPFQALSELSSLPMPSEISNNIKVEAEDGKNVALYKVVDSHCHPHLEGEEIEDYAEFNQALTNKLEDISLLQITCATSYENWETCLEYASKNEPFTIPAIGIHPWYVMEENLPEDWLDQLGTLLLKHPGAVVGEIGLCKCAREVRYHPAGKAAVLSRQREIFEAQMKLAAKLRRPVSVHCVQQMGPMMTILKSTLEKGEGGAVAASFPPAIAFHSFTGTSEQVKRILEIEEEIKRRSEVDIQEPIMYFGFSHLVNYIMCSSEKSVRKGRGKSIQKFLND